MLNHRCALWVLSSLAAVLTALHLPACDSRKSPDEEPIGQEAPTEASTPEPSTPEQPTAPVEWVAIDGGTFQMGSDDRSSDERPIHEVVVPTFEMMRTEVTVGHYRSCVEAGECDQPMARRSSNFWSEPSRQNHPLNFVDWQAAANFCRWLGGRLPSEAEWEYAARSGGQAITFPWGEVGATCERVAMLGCGEDDTTPVCNVPAGNTEQGLCDMAGNVWEWVSDDYHDSYAGAPSTAQAWVDSPEAYRVLRGGSNGYGAFYLRTAGRRRFARSGDDRDVGFRCVRSPAAE